MKIVDILPEKCVPVLPDRGGNTPPEAGRTGRLSAAKWYDCTAIQKKRPFKTTVKTEKNAQKPRKTRKKP